MQRLEVSGAVWPIYGSLGVKRLINKKPDVYVWVKPRPNTHTKRGLRFLPQYRISYMWGLLHSHFIYRCLLKVLCPVSRPITTLDCVPLKDNNRAPVARSGPEINSRARLCVDSSWNVMAHGDALEGKWRGNWRMEWVASTLHTTSEHGVSSITTSDRERDH